MGNNDINDSIIAISDTELDKLISDLSSYIDTISSSFNKMGELVSESNSYFIGELSNQFRAKYDSFEGEYETIIANLDTYRTDMINIKNNVIGKDKSLVTSEIDKISYEEGGNISGVN